MSLLQPTLKDNYNLFLLFILSLNDSSTLSLHFCNMWTTYVKEVILDENVNLSWRYTIAYAKNSPTFNLLLGCQCHCECLLNHLNGQTFCIELSEWKGIAQCRKAIWVCAISNQTRREKRYPLERMPITHGAVYTIFNINFIQVYGVCVCVPLNQALPSLQYPFAVTSYHCTMEYVWLNEWVGLIWAHCHQDCHWHRNFFTKIFHACTWFFHYVSIFNLQNQRYRWQWNKWPINYYIFIP